jgi:hypothetical protein
MRRLSERDYRRMPWKNGGGETIEIAVAPAGATLADFDWRVSCARVAAAGPFSAFPGVDRSIAAVRGTLRLRVAQDPPVVLTPQSEPLAFAGEEAVSAEPVDAASGPLVDFNVMTRRARWSHRLQRVNLLGSDELAVAGRLLVLHCAHGSVECRGNASPLVLAADDTLVADAREDGAALALRASGGACLYAAHLVRKEPGGA